MERMSSRVFSFETNHGQVTTPLFMPVGTIGAVKGVSPEETRATGAQIMLSNTYHMHVRLGEEIVKKQGGLQKFTGWNGPMLTDSGGFQVFSLAKLRKITEEGVTFAEPRTGSKIVLKPEKSMQIQFDLGADIIMAFDDVVSLDGSEEGREREAMERSMRWLERCVAEHKRLSEGMEKPPLLFGIVQGGLDKELRKESLEFVQSQPVAGIAIGGLSVGEPREEMFEMLEYLEPFYDDSRPRYLMGVGHPIDMRFAIEHGIDMFDCVLPTRNARHGTAWIAGDKQVNLRSEVYKEDSGPLDVDCDCSTCTGPYSRSLIRHMLHVGEMLAGRLISIHNLRYVQRICEEYKA
jgi:queuine tRNA-ribosyltransferase